ncbi:hypothetical protein AGRA3207_003960 [Actinomadura graeca]|uniref:Secreted protein n=1 Tax=Actinomadura graeca TaxID=2750812 RepID=A0ABX8QVM4_9ACTN|nr:hypothetical protein [Actinomadura graeca]QXJ22885.1 hypothetical protein AGRA3207_003960 [Actinomadura graeca]
MTTTAPRRALTVRAATLVASAVLTATAMAGLAGAATAGTPGGTVDAVLGAPAPQNEAAPGGTAAQDDAAPGAETDQNDAATKAAPCWPSGGRWWCNNRRGAKVVARDGALVGYMYTTTSWFSYRCEGGRNNNGPHPNRWAYTQADNGRWGYMSDGDINSETNPLPARGHC